MGVIDNGVARGRLYEVDRAQYLGRHSLMVA